MWLNGSGTGKKVMIRASPGPTLLKACGTLGGMTSVWFCANVLNIIPKACFKCSFQNHNKLVSLVRMKRRARADANDAVRHAAARGAVAGSGDVPLVIVRPPGSLRYAVVVDDGHGYLTLKCDSFSIMGSRSVQTERPVVLMETPAP